MAAAEGLAAQLLGDGRRECGQRDVSTVTRGPVLHLCHPVGEAPPQDHNEREADQLRIAELDPGRYAASIVVEDAEDFNERKRRADVTAPPANECVNN